MILSIEAVKRITEKKSDLVELRNNGFIPAVIYGEGIEALSIAVKSAEFTKSIKKASEKWHFMM
jgi:large subunit ribosomal protein L25